MGGNGRANAAPRILLPRISERPSVDGFGNHDGMKVQHNISKWACWGSILSTLS